MIAPTQDARRSPLWRLGVALLAAPVFALATPFACATATIDIEALQAALASEGRAASDRERDAGRKPAEVVAFLGIGPSMTVIDLIAAAGYYTEVLSVAVGPDGKVYAQNNAFVLKMRDGAADKAMSTRLAGGRLANVERLDREIDDLGLADNSVDAAVTALNLHDVYNGSGEEATVRFLGRVLQILKPGGVLGIVDHHGDDGRDNAELHRMQEVQAIEVAKAAGFELEASADILRFPDDDHSQNVFAPAVRGRTDRFVLLLRKP